LPSVVCASKSGAVSLIESVITQLRQVRVRDRLGTGIESTTQPLRRPSHKGSLVVVVLPLAMRSGRLGFDHIGLPLFRVVNE